ncbi:unnamed protein product [Trichogramma brassicae]|uniref:Uncharacterized protein n=1 Tax=Trichogramma brassicae TaxID=86971 RepID=A0A6H5J8Y7_9HYME|nr:unnamed protein product [Trichogramma brassicae]
MTRRRSSCECFAMRHFKKKDQIFIHYGSRTNTEFFIHSGFLPENNRNDSFRLRLGAVQQTVLLLLVMTIFFGNEFSIKCRIGPRLFPENRQVSQGIYHIYSPTQRYLRNSSGSIDPDLGSRGAPASVPTETFIMLVLISPKYNYVAQEIQTILTRCQNLFHNFLKYLRRKRYSKHQTAWKEIDRCRSTLRTSRTLQKFIKVHTELCDDFLRVLAIIKKSRLSEESHRPPSPDPNLVPIQSKSESTILKLQELLKWNGWGYKDSSFAVNKTQTIEFTGNREVKKFPETWALELVISSPSQSMRNTGYFNYPRGSGLKISGDSPTANLADVLERELREQVPNPRGFKKKSTWNQ